jgi:transposase
LISVLRHLIQQSAAAIQPQTALKDNVVETDALFRNAGEKGTEYVDPLDPPRCRANIQRGRGTYANDRPPVLGLIGRESGQVCLRVVSHTRNLTLCGFVEQFTQPDALVYTDEYDSYNAIKRLRVTVCHGAKDWARDEDGNGWFETPTISTEGMWTGLRHFLRPFRGVHKRYVHGYVAVQEFRIHLQAMSPVLIAALVRRHSF